MSKHTDSGDHAQQVIKAAHLLLGTDSGEVNVGILPVAASLIMRGINYPSDTAVSTLLQALVSNITLLFPYANGLPGRYGLLADIPVADSTANVDVTEGGIMMMDGIACTIGQMVFLKDQTDKKQNGFREVQSGAWNRYPGYTAAEPSAFVNKFILVKTWAQNAGKCFILIDLSHAETPSGKRCIQGR